MAKAMYIGVHEDAYLSTNISNTNVRKFVTTNYKSIYGFKIKFIPHLINDSYQHILNVGGRGNNTIFCLSLHSGDLQLEVPTSTTASTKQVVGAVAYAIDTAYEVEYLVDTTTGVGTFKVNGSVVGTLSNIDTSASASSNQMCLFNCASTAAADARPTQIDWFYLEIYDGDTLVSRFTPASGPAITEETGGTSTTTSIANVIYTAAADVAHKVIKIYVGDSNNQARNVIAGYVGNSNDEASYFFGTPTPPPSEFTFNLTGTYDTGNSSGELVLQVVGHNIEATGYTGGEDPIQIYYDDGQGGIQSLCYYMSDVTISDNKMSVPISDGSYIEQAILDGDAKFMMEGGLIQTTDTQIPNPYITDAVITWTII